MKMIYDLGIEYSKIYPQPNEIMAFYANVKEVTALNNATDMITNMNTKSLRFLINEIKGMHGMSCDDLGINLTIGKKTIRIWDIDYGFRIPVSYTQKL